jgi:hypothetical protein
MKDNLFGWSSIALFGGDRFLEPQMQGDKRGWTQMDERDIALTD